MTYVSLWGTAAFKHYISAQAALGYLNQYHAGVTESNFEGIPIKWCPGMAAKRNGSRS